MGPMRIVYVLTSLGIGGAEKQALAVADRMARRGHEIALLVLKPRVAKEWPNTLRSFHLDMRRTPASLLAGLSRARLFVANFHPDIVHSHSLHAKIFARLLTIGLPRLAMISTVHNVNEGGWMRMLAYRFTNRMSRKTVAVSEATRERFTRLKAVSTRKCIVVRNGIDVVEFVPDAEHRAKARIEMGVSSHPNNGEFVWLAVGRIVPAKDYPNLLRAFEGACAEKPDSRLWIAGEDKCGDSAPLKHLAAELRVNDKIRWLGLRRDVPSLMNAADAYVSASAWEGMPLAVGEAMAMEKPVVATDVGGVGELVGDTGMVVPARNPEALAKAMIGVMQQNCEERCTRGRAARDRIVNTFSVDSAVDAWEALYRDLIH
jgi:glycosyltransferase involved in cell wall biosynthesis